MKQVKLGPGQWNEGFLDFARHHGFTPKTHRVRRVIGRIIVQHRKVLAGT